MGIDHDLGWPLVVDDDALLLELRSHDMIARSRIAATGVTRR